MKRTAFVMINNPPDALLKNFCSKLSSIGDFWQSQTDLGIYFEVREIDYENAIEEIQKVWKVYYPYLLWFTKTGVEVGISLKPLFRIKPSPKHNMEVFTKSLSVLTGSTIEYEQEGCGKFFIFSDSLKSNVVEFVEKAFQFIELEEAYQRLDSFGK